VAVAMEKRVVDETTAGCKDKRIVERAAAARPPVVQRRVGCSSRTAQL